METWDVNGVNNFYIEDSDFHAFLNSMDGDENGKVVVRNCLSNNSGIGTHGADTSNYGVRHYEIYYNTFLWKWYPNGTSMNLTYYIFLRGGTGVITDNAITDITSVDYGNKAEIIAIDMNLQRMPVLTHVGERNRRKSVSNAATSRDGASDRHGCRRTGKKC